MNWINRFFLYVCTMKKLFTLMLGLFAIVISSTISCVGANVEKSDLPIYMPADDVMVIANLEVMDTEVFVVTDIGSLPDYIVEVNLAYMKSYSDLILHTENYIATYSDKHSEVAWFLKSIPNYNKLAYSQNYHKNTYHYFGPFLC